MVSGKTKSGFKYSIDERVKDDYRLIKAYGLAKSSNEEEQVLGATKLVSLILGKQEDAFLEHLAKKNDGYAPTSEVMKELNEIISSINELKN